MKNIDININTPTISNNVQLISKIGSNLGTQFFKVEVRDAWPGGPDAFEREKRAFEKGEKKGFILNRSPRRLLAKNILITGTVLVTNPLNDDEVGIGINPKDDGTFDLFLPINDSTLRSMGKTTVDAIAEAIRGEKDHFFLDGKTLVNMLNDVMKREIEYLEEHIVNCQKMMVTLKGTINDNTNKAKLVEDMWTKSAIKEDIQLPNGKAVITIEQTEE